MSGTENVTESLEAARISPAGPLRQLRWKVAEAALRDLAACARQHLG
jgi:hypothetical protein